MLSPEPRGGHEAARIFRLFRWGGVHGRLSAHAQQRERMRHIGLLLPWPRTTQNFRRGSERSCRGLQQVGWTLGRNVRIDTRWARSNAAGIRKHAAELAALAPDVILAPWRPHVSPLLQATRTVPIVFAVGPIRSPSASSIACRGQAATLPVS